MDYTSVWPSGSCQEHWKIRGTWVRREGEGMRGLRDRGHSGVRDLGIKG